jgi:hypothetical protein
MYNLVEGNRLGHAGPPPDGNGAISIEMSSGANLVRYNISFNAGEKHYMFYPKANSPANNNILYNNIGYRTRGLRVANYGIYCHSSTSGSEVRNNISTLGNQGDINSACSTSANVVNNWTSSEGDPHYDSTDISDKTSTTEPTLVPLVGYSPTPIDNGTYLTTVSSVTDSDTIVVGRSEYFQDGTWGSPLSDIQADWICLTASSTTVTYGNCVQISSINYGTDTIDTASAHGASAGWYVWLYKKSDGTRVLYGTAPDQGAHEYSGLLPPLNLRILP